jgi:hypothetical protein
MNQLSYHSLFVVRCQLSAMGCEKGSHFMPLTLPQKPGVDCRIMVPNYMPLILSKRLTTLADWIVSERLVAIPYEVPRCNRG